MSAHNVAFVINPLVHLLHLLNKWSDWFMYGSINGGTPQARWMVSFMENPHLKCMRTGGTPHDKTETSICIHMPCSFPLSKCSHKYALVLPWKINCVGNCRNISRNSPNHPQVDTPPCYQSIPKPFVRSLPSMLVILNVHVQSQTWDVVSLKCV